MIHETLSNVAMVLRDQAGQVSEDVWCVLRQAAVVLETAAQEARRLEDFVSPCCPAAPQHRGSNPSDLKSPEAPC